MSEIIISTVIGIIINTIIDYVLFRVWHHYAHREVLADRRIEDSKDIHYLKREEKLK